MIEIDGSTCRMCIVVDDAANFHHKSKSVLPPPPTVSLCRSITSTHSRYTSKRDITHVSHGEGNFIDVRKNEVSCINEPRGFLCRLLSLSLALSLSPLPSRGSHYIYYERDNILLKWVFVSEDFCPLYTLLRTRGLHNNSSNRTPAYESVPRFN